MQKKMQRFGGFALSALAAAMLAACGGGGSSSALEETSGSSGTTTEAPAAPAPTVTKTAVTLSGVVATGAAFSDSQVTVTDRTGATVGTSGVVGDDGQYSVTLSEGAQAPFVLVAQRTTASGEVQSLVSVSDSDTSGTVNVTPVTHMIAARLSPSGDPLALPAAVQAEPARVSAATVAAAVAEANTVLAPLLAATGTSVTVNPLTTPITTNGTGYDRLLDSVQVTVTPQTDNSSRIEVAFKVQQADPSAQPPAVQFTSNASVAQLVEKAAAVSLAAADLVPSGTSARIAEFFAGATACYALPLEQRVDNASATDTAVVGTAANISATACRGLFAGSDPATYLSNGVRVGRTASNGGAFAGIFRRGSMGVTFSQGAYEFTRANGDIVVSYKVRDTAGAETFDSLVLRANATSGKLEAIGNQYAYGGSVQAYHQFRHYVTPDSTGASQAAYDFSSTGYTVHVPNAVDTAGAPIFNRVVVTTPRGSTLTLKPTSGVSYLVLAKADGSLTGSTNFVRLRSRFVDPQTAGHPRDVDTGLFYVGTDLEESEIADMAHQSVWKYDYYLAGNTGTTPDATQHYKTRARALSLGELSQKGLAKLTSDSLTGLLGRAGSLRGQVLLPTDGPLTGIAYEVPSGALPPTSATLWGRLGTADRIDGARFDDNGGMPSTARTTQIGCSLATNADVHCGTGGGYAGFAYMNSLHLWAREATGREFARLYAMYRLR